ncbi:MAG: hypothetical protein HC769_30815 [Cyanobacteria bacterium CRU_2_1]|nr:hypothetical protein [Cyanobacteria bacterium CRU_2_1]
MTMNDPTECLADPNAIGDQGGGAIGVDRRKKVGNEKWVGGGGSDAATLSIGC